MALLLRVSEDSLLKAATRLLLTSVGHFGSELCNCMRGKLSLRIWCCENKSISKNTYLLINFTGFIEIFIHANPLHQTKPVFLLGMLGHPKTIRITVKLCLFKKIHESKVKEVMCWLHSALFEQLKLCLLLGGHSTNIHKGFIMKDTSAALLVHDLRGTTKMIYQSSRTPSWGEWSM